MKALIIDKETYILKQPPFKSHKVFDKDGTSLDIYISANSVKPEITLNFRFAYDCDKVIRHLYNDLDHKITLKINNQSQVINVGTSNNY